MAGGPVRGGSRAIRGPRGDVHGHGAHLRRARPTYLGRRRRRGHFDRPRHRHLQRQERPVLRGLRPRCEAGAAGMDPAGPCLRRRRSGANRPRGRARGAGGTRSLGRRRRLAPDLPARERDRRARGASRRDRRRHRTRWRRRARRRRRARPGGAPGAVAGRDRRALRDAARRDVGALGRGRRRSRRPHGRSRSVWRARDMVGAMFQGEASFFVEGKVGSGSTSLRSVLGAPGEALVRVRPRRVVWWKGWSSGSADVR